MSTATVCIEEVELQIVYDCQGEADCLIESVTVDGSDQELIWLVGDKIGRIKAALREQARDAAEQAAGDAAVLRQMDCAV